MAETPESPGQQEQPQEQPQKQSQEQTPEQTQEQTITANAPANVEVDTSVRYPSIAVIKTHCLPERSTRTTPLMAMNCT